MYPLWASAGGCHALQTAAIAATHAAVDGCVCVAGKSYAGPPKGAASLETGPSLDPLQATRALAEAAEVKRQLMMSQSVKAAAEAEAKRAAEAKKAAEAAAAAAQAAAAAAPAKPVSKRRYKLLSVYALLPPSMRREEWSLSQFAVEKRLHKGYASEVYKVCIMLFNAFHAHCGT